jgi:hypothetical protein
MPSGWGPRERLWLGLVAVPLAEVAAGLLGLLWTWPLLLVCAWLWTPSWQWLWVLALELGCVGLAWADLGIHALARSTTDQRWLVGAVWAAFPLALAGVGIRHRRFFSPWRRMNRQRLGLRQLGRIRSVARRA